MELSYRLDLREDSQWLFFAPGGYAGQHLLHVQEAGHFHAGPTYYTTRSGLDSFLIKLTLDGRGKLSCTGRDWLLPAGTFFFIDCNKPQDYRTDPEADFWDVLWVHFNGPEACALHRTFLEANHGQSVARMSDIEKAEACIHAILKNGQEHRQGSCLDLDNASLLLSLISECVRSTGESADAASVPPLMSDIRTWLNENYTARITLDDLAARFHLSSFYLQRQFVRYYGQSPARYLNSLRIARAKEYLRATDSTVTEIAVLVGFDSASHLISTFRKQEQQTPLQYRHSWAGSEESWK